MNKRETAQQYVDFYDLPQSWAQDIFVMSADDPELSAYYGYPQVQLRILFERFLMQEVELNLLDEAA